MKRTLTLATSLLTLLNYYVLGAVSIVEKLLTATSIPNIGTS